MNSPNRVVPTSAVEDETPQSSGALAPYQIVLTLGLVLTFVAYIGTLGFPFVYDDRSQIVQNPWIQSWRFVPRYFTHRIWAWLALPEVPGNYYRPLFLLWLRLNYVVFGLNPWGWHLTSILLHLGVTLLVYFLVVRLCGDRVTAALASMIFGVHPVHIESVAWISGATDPLVAFLLLSSFLCYLKKQERGHYSTAWLAASLFLYALAMLSKETALVLPMLIFAYEWIFGPNTREGSWRGLFIQKLPNALRSTLPYLVLTLPCLVARASVLEGFGRTVVPLSLTTIVYTWPSLLWLYVSHLVWPFDIDSFYDTPYVRHPGFLAVALPAAALLGLAFILWWWARQPGDGTASADRGSKSRVVAFATAWLLLPITPLLNLRFLPLGDFAHDRYMYLPSTGFVIIAALALRDIRFAPGRPFRRLVVQGILPGAVVTAFLLGTAFQSVVWADDLLVYAHAMRVGLDGNWYTTNLANVLAERGLYDDAITMYRRTLARTPAHWGANYNLGYTYYRLGRLADAEFYLRRAVALYSDNPDEFLYLGLTRFKLGRLDEAATALRQAIQIRPDARGCHFALGVVLKMQGNLAGALEEFKAELVNNPKEQAARDQMAEVEARMRGARSEGQGRARFSSPKTEGSR